jgi:hypothetical protein
MRKILIAVTFRPFNGGDYNSKIQELFIKSIASQTYLDYELIVTTYSGEKSPRKILEKYISKFTIYEDNSQSYYFKTIDNAVKHSERGQNIILWSNADSIFDSNFFEEIIRNFVEGQAGTSYPNLHYYNLDDFGAGRINDIYSFKENNGRPELSKRRYLNSFFSYDPNIYIAEAQYIDADLLMDHKGGSVYRALLDCSHVPGVSIFLSISALAKTHVNLIYKTKIHIIENSRISGSTTKLKKDDNLEQRANTIESKTDRFNTYNDEYKKIIKWSEGINIDLKYHQGSMYSSKKFIMHSTFEPVGSVLQKLIYRSYLMYWWMFPRKKFKLFSLFKKIY